MATLMERTRAFLNSMDTVSPKTRDHVRQVYNLLLVAFAACAVGAYLGTVFYIGYTLATVLLFVATGLIAFSRTSPFRIYYFLGAAFLSGYTLAPLIEAVDDTGLVLTALVATAAVFGSFSGAALLAPRRSYLFLGGFLTAGLSSLLILSLFRFLGPDLAFRVDVYGGLVLFSGFVVFDTQMIIERAEAGVRDAVSDAYTLFLDALNLFVRILIALAKDKGGKKKK